MNNVTVNRRKNIFLPVFLFNFPALCRNSIKKYFNQTVVLYHEIRLIINQKKALIAGSFAASAGSIAANAGSLVASAV